MFLCRGNSFYAAMRLPMLLQVVPHSCSLGKHKKLFEFPNWTLVKLYFVLSLVSYEEGLHICICLSGDRVPATMTECLLAYPARELGLSSYYQKELFEGCIHLLDHKRKSVAPLMKRKYSWYFIQGKVIGCKELS